MRGDLLLSDFANQMIAVQHYSGLQTYFTQLGNADGLQSERKDFYESTKLSHWDDINIHLIKQRWGSTSCGWGGMGGASMTNSYTSVIENSYLRICSVYYDGELVYICKMDDNYYETVSSLDELPGLYEVSKKGLTLLYKRVKNK